MRRKLQAIVPEPKYQNNSAVKKLRGCLVGASVYALFNGLWPPDLLTIGLILVADLNMRLKRFVCALIFTVFVMLLHPILSLINLTFLGIWLLWETGVMGGADANLLIAITLVTGNPAILIPIAVTGGIQGVFASLRKQILCSLAIPSPRQY